MTDATPRLLAGLCALLVVDKPAGWLVHPASGDPAPDLLAWARAAGAPAKVAPAHRLDRETSGLVLLSADPELLAALGAAFAAGRVTKRYLALVHGHPRKGGTIDRALADDRRGAPLQAVTRYRTVERFATASLVALEPETGRKHQLRRHLERLGHPIVGDRRYARGARGPVPGAPDRLWLHAAQLIAPPLPGLPDGLDLTAELPPELATHLAALRGA